MLAALTPTKRPRSAVLASCPCVAGVDLGSHSAKVVLAAVSEPREIVAAARLVYPAALAGDPLGQAEWVGEWLTRWTANPIGRTNASLPQALADYEATPLDGGAELDGRSVAAHLQRLLGADANRVTADH